MSIFAGGSTLSAATAVCTDATELPAAQQDTELLDRLGSLVDKSLIRCEEQAGGELRFGMVETLREFGLACLQDSGEYPLVAQRHAEYYTALAEAAAQQMATPSQPVWLARIDAEQGNLRAALQWTTHNVIGLGLRLGAALAPYWVRRGRYQEALGHVKVLLQQCPDQEPRSPVEVLLHYAGIFSLRRSNISTAYRYFQQSAAASRKTGNRAFLSDALALMADLSFERGDYAAADALHAEGLLLAREVEDAFGLAMKLSRYGRMLASRGQVDEGGRLCAQGLAVLREIGDPWGMAFALRNVGLVRYLEGDLAGAHGLLEQALQLSRTLEDVPTVATNLYILGRICSAQGDTGAARALLCEALPLHHQVDSISRIADTLDAFAQVALADGRPERTLRLVAAAAAMRASVGFVLAPLFRAEVEQTAQTAHHALTAYAARSAWAEGTAMTLDEAVVYALAD
jgi:tetratricopeptide (TPR) repeat protein